MKLTNSPYDNFVQHALGAAVLIIVLACAILFLDWLYTVNRIAFWLFLTWAAWAFSCNCHSAWKDWRKG